MKRSLIVLLSVVLFLVCAVSAQAVTTLDSTGVASGQRINAASDTTCLQVAPNGTTQQVIVMVGPRPTTAPSHSLVRIKPIVSKPDTTVVRAWSSFSTVPWWGWLLLGLLVLAVLVEALRGRDRSVTNNNNLECPGCDCDPQLPVSPVARAPEGITIVIPPDALGRDLELTLKINGPKPPDPPAA